MDSALLVGFSPWHFPPIRHALTKTIPATQSLKTMLIPYFLNAICLYLGLNLTVMFPLAAISDANLTRKSFLETQAIIALFSAAITGLAM